MKLKNKQQLESWLEQGELSAVIEELKKQLKASRTGKVLYADALVLSAQLKKINSDKIERILSYEQESLALNNYRRSLVDFIQMIENHEPDEPLPPIVPPKPSPVAAGKGGGFAWWWLLLPALVLGGWWLFKETPVTGGGGQESIIKICTLHKMSNQGHCCTDDLQRISLFESNGMLYVTAVFPGMTEKDPEVIGTVYWESGDVFPAKPIRLTLDSTIGDLCYVSMIQPIHGTAWSLNKFVLKLQVNGQPAGEKVFEIIR